MTSNGQYGNMTCMLGGRVAPRWIGTVSEAGSAELFCNSAAFDLKKTDRGWRIYKVVGSAPGADIDF